MKNQYYSQVRQDEFLNIVVFNNKENGYFIDIGAHNGQTFSNSLFFELYKNWKGICIEPNPNVFKKLDSFRKSINLNVCIGESDKVVKFTQIEGYAEMLSGISEKYDKRHIERIERDLESKGGKRTEIDVKMMKLDSIEELKNRQVDFVSIDTEGNEFDILSSINFNKIDIKALVVENNYGDSRIKEYLLEFDYIPLIKLDFDEVYLNKNCLSIGIKFRLKIWKLNLFLNRVLKKLKINK
ncbi:hypothetical protein C3L50_01430 [Flavobacterium alvei]|uniref:Methyltransferase FkbM domain-containing protein n=1 Tax=Flavobacterium alvei TaxID=2080416 RepID=A0A2S5AF73_9FLAO|nr:FkbM family methyltransferase [Flavobacterium alvei]POY41210.1 hypothetical protein C3L50_01430 [Flavobacterium alvei]